MGPKKNLQDNGQKYSCKFQGKEVEIDLHYVPGSIVWAKLGSYPWWPAMVDENPNTYHFCKIKHDNAYYNITFLDEKVTRCWISSDKMCPYASTQKNKNILSKKKGKILATDLLKAEERAKIAIELSIVDRLKKFSFVHLYKRKWPHFNKVPSDECPCADSDTNDPNYIELHSASDFSETEVSELQRRKTRSNIQNTVEEITPGVEVTEKQPRKRKRLTRNKRQFILADNGQNGSCNRQKKEVEIDLHYVPGSIVWAKLGSYPWWPAMVDENPNTDHFWKIKDGNTYYNITFLDEKVTRCWISSDKMCPFAQKTENILSKKKFKILSTDLLKAEERAKIAIELSIVDRLEKFSFVHLYERKWPHFNEEKSVSHEYTSQINKLNAEASTKKSTHTPATMLRSSRKMPEVASPEKKKITEADIHFCVNSIPEIQDSSDEDPFSDSDTNDPNYIELHCASDSSEAEVSELQRRKTRSNKQNSVEEITPGVEVTEKQPRKRKRLTRNKQQLGLAEKSVSHEYTSQINQLNAEASTKKKKHTPAAMLRNSTKIPENSVEKKTVIAADTKGLENCMSKIQGIKVSQELKVTDKFRINADGNDITKFKKEGKFEIEDDETNCLILIEKNINLLSKLLDKSKSNTSASEVSKCGKS